MIVSSFSPCVCFFSLLFQSVYDLEKQKALQNRLREDFFFPKKKRILQKLPSPRPHKTNKLHKLSLSLSLVVVVVVVVVVLTTE
jgi:hypothetical protein